MLHVFRPQRFAAGSKSQVCQGFKTDPPQTRYPPHSSGQNQPQIAAAREHWVARRLDPQGRGCRGSRSCRRCHPAPSAAINPATRLRRSESVGLRGA